MARIICGLKSIVKFFYNRLNFNQNQPVSWLQRWLHTYLPCLLCGIPAAKSLRITALCTHCADILPWYTAASCPQCGLPTPSGLHCGVCLQHPPAFDRTLAPFRYDYPLDRLLHQFKYRQQLPIGKVLAEAAYPYLRDQLGTRVPDVILAMPMHPHRLQLRGFNHALELATLMQRKLRIPLDMHGCQRIVDTPSQAGMDLKTRTRSLRGAFYSQRAWQGKHVLIVDDVMTTAASMQAVASVLKQAGAGQVTALVIARTLKHGER